MPYIRDPLKRDELAQFFSTFLGRFTHYRNQGEWLFDCPACGRRKFSINFGKMAAHCWRCHDMSYGRLDRFLKHHFPEHLGEYLEILADSDSIILPQEEEEPAQPIEIEMPPGFQQLSGGVAARPFVNYLLRRGAERFIKEYEIGFCSSGSLHDRVVFPSQNRHGNPNYFIARAAQSSTINRHHISMPWPIRPGSSSMSIASIGRSHWSSRRASST
jgi:hypothetical protein